MAALDGPAETGRTTSGAQLLDSRGIGKVPNFNGKREEFEEWIFPFEWAGRDGPTALATRQR